MSVAATGTQSATPTTEHDLASTSTAGVYNLQVDCNALADGEAVTLRFYTKATSGGTERVMRIWAVTAPLIFPIVVTEAYRIEHGLRVTLTQNNGSGRSFGWSLIRSDA